MADASWYCTNVYSEWSYQCIKRLVMNIVTKLCWVPVRSSESHPGSWARQNADSFKGIYCLLYKSSHVQLPFTILVRLIVSMVTVYSGVQCKCQYCHVGWTPLHEAANHGHAVVVTYLLDNGANINAPGMDGDTPLHDAVENDHFTVSSPAGGTSVARYSLLIGW